MSQLVRDAANFAKYRHEAVHAEIYGAPQLRKYDNRPYFEHCFEVATLVRAVGCDEEVIAAAYLHDTVEDTVKKYLDGKLDPGGDRDPLEEQAMFILIGTRFGHRVSSLVREVTDVSKRTDGNRKARKAIDREHLSTASGDGKSIKLADLNMNTQDIVRNDPDFAKVYLPEKVALMPHLRGGNSVLFGVAADTLSWANVQLARHRGKNP